MTEARKMEEDEEGIDMEMNNIQVNLPKDVIIEILSWLPVKSLLRFRSVSKAWKNLIDQPLFISIHQSKMKSHLLVIYYDKTIKSTNCLFYLDESLSNNYQDFNLVRYSISGPCNGIFALINNNERMALWNPATKQFRVLPVENRPQHSPNPYNDSKNLMQIGLGFDPNANDYKVVWYREFGDRTPIYQLLVYSLNTHSWRELDPEKFTSFNHKYTLDYEPLSFNGVLYWKAMGNGMEDQTFCLKWLLPFDLSDEQFQDEIPLPNPSPGLGLRILDVFCDSIATIDCIYTERGVESVNIWVMVEKGNWVRKFEIGPFEGIRRPFRMWKNENVVLETNDHELVVCDFLGQIWKNVPPFGSRNLECFKTLVYNENLVSIKGVEHGNGSNEEEDDVLAGFLLLALSLNG